MAYYLKQTKLKGRTYLSIDESFYSNEKKGTAHRCYKSLQSVESWKKKGIEDPVAHFQKEVDELNRQRQDDGTPKISDTSPVYYLGYFPLKAIMKKLQIQKLMKYFQLTNDFQYDLFELLSTLVYARVVNPYSKHRTFHEVLPSLFDKANYSYDQLLDGLAYLGNDYEKIVEIFTEQTKSTYSLDTSKTYFDCTNFYFEIDREDDFRRKGPSKERRTDPIVGLGLLLDHNQIPIGMRMYPGNESEKPVLRKVIDQLKKKNNITGKTIHVADKGLNCAQNIAFSKKNGDGYLFSKSVKGLPETEKTWVRLDQDFKEKRDKSGKLLYRYKSCIDEFPYDVEYEGQIRRVKLTEKRLLTYNPTLAAKQKHEFNRMIEKAKGLTLSGAKKSEYGETGKYVSFTDKSGKKAEVSLNQKAIDKDFEFAGYNLLVTSETDMKDEDMYTTYHNLWRIEESFQIMKSDLDARPAFCQKEETIKGHFLVCYITVLLERLFQFNILKSSFSSSEIFQLMKDFKVTKSDRGYINTLRNSDLCEELEERFGIPIRNFFLSETQIKSILNCNF